MQCPPPPCAVQETIHSQAEEEKAQDAAKTAEDREAAGEPKPDVAVEVTEDEEKPEEIWIDNVVVKALK